MTAIDRFEVEEEIKENNNYRKFYYDDADVSADIKEIKDENVLFYIANGKWRSMRYWPGTYATLDTDQTQVEPAFFKGTIKS